MTEREQLRASFIATTSWRNAKVLPLAGDASNRKYLRLEMNDGRSAVLMDAPPDKGENIRPFIQVALYLRSLGLSAPQIFEHDEVRGFLLLEDLGDALFARILEHRPELETTLYTAAVDVLFELHKRDAPAFLQHYTPDIMAEMSSLAFDWYLRGIRGVDCAAKDTFLTAMKSALSRIEPKTVLIQRDYHAENLLWLPDRAGFGNVGLLDFQDAMSGHPAYDLVSLLQDARRDVSKVVETSMIELYIKTCNCDADQFRADYQILGAQRNLRILGVFARLCLRDGKSHYVDLIPRVWDHLMADLMCPALADVAGVVQNSLPPPTQVNLKVLKEKCAAIQNL